MKNYARLAAMLFALALISPFSATAQNAKITFLDNDFEAAQTHAASAEKLILMKFSACWCLPCRVMDEYVWPNPALAEKVNESCVALAVDIQNFDGIGLKQQFLVETLPTILLLNACGEPLVRFETSCSASQILEQIRFFDTPENRFCPADPTKVLATKSVEMNFEKTFEKGDFAFLSKPVSHRRADFLEPRADDELEYFSMPFDLPMH